MKFIDEVKIQVEAGKGGDGRCGFLRLKFMPFGGPDGGDGGDGGSIYLRAQQGINTLIDYRFVHHYKAKDGEKGGTRNCSGKAGDDLMLPVPIGTIVYDEVTGEQIADLTDDEQIVCVAKGGRHGVGNARFKSSTNRSPRRTIPGQLGEVRQLHLELKVLADVGLVGMPNAGKSTLIRAMSAATPKVADYPFTTLHPQLGVVQVAQFQSFVVADLPGLIAGAHQGAGLGIRFLKHVARTKILYHVVDIAPADGSDPVTNVQMIQNELEQYDLALTAKPCWLVLNKTDLLPPDDVAKHCQDIVTRLNWQSKVFIISGLAKAGLEPLVNETMACLEEPE
jgi:GTPase